VFFDWAERAARAASARRVRVFFPAGHELGRVAAARGYERSRSSYVMEIALAETPSVPPLTSGIELRTYRLDVDEDAVRSAVNEAFADDPLFHEQTPEMFREFNLGARGFDPALWLLAWDGDALAGVSLTYRERVGEPDLGWVGILGVRPPWRRRGLGEVLLRASFAALYDRGLRRVGLGVDTENVTGALRLYERAGMHVVREGHSYVLEL
jgi:mycothiol synthase